MGFCLSWNVGGLKFQVLLLSRKGRDCATLWKVITSIFPICFLTTMSKNIGATICFFIHHMILVFCFDLDKRFSILYQIDKVLLLFVFRYRGGVDSEGRPVMVVVGAHFLLRCLDLERFILYVVKV